MTGISWLAPWLLTRTTIESTPDRHGRALFLFGTQNALRASDRAMRVVLLVLLSACVIAPRSLEMPDASESTVALLTGTLGHPLDGIARHPWFAVRRKGEADWHIFEVGGGGHEQDPFHHHSSWGDPILHKVWRGEEA